MRAEEIQAVLLLSTSQLQLTVQACSHVLVWGRSQRQRQRHTTKLQPQLLQPRTLLQQLLQPRNCRKTGQQLLA
jgi:hypothetical protein